MLRQAPEVTSTPKQPRQGKVWTGGTQPHTHRHPSAEGKARHRRTPGWCLQRETLRKETKADKHTDVHAGGPTRDRGSRHTHMSKGETQEAARAHGVIDMETHSQRPPRGGGGGVSQGSTHTQAQAPPSPTHSHPLPHPQPPSLAPRALYFLPGPLRSPSHHTATSGISQDLGSHVPARASKTTFPRTHSGLRSEGPLLTSWEPGRRACGSMSQKPPRGTRVREVESAGDLG